MVTWLGTAVVVFGVLGWGGAFFLLQQQTTMITMIAMRAAAPPASKIITHTSMRGEKVAAQELTRPYINYSERWVGAGAPPMRMMPMAAPPAPGAGGGGGRGRLPSHRSQMPNQLTREHSSQMQSGFMSQQLLASHTLGWEAGHLVRAGAAKRTRRSAESCMTRRDERGERDRAPAGRDARRRR